MHHSLPKVQVQISGTETLETFWSLHGRLSGVRIRNTSTCTLYHDWSYNRLILLCARMINFDLALLQPDA